MIDDRDLPSYTLDGIDLADIRYNSVNDGRFVATLRRRVFSIHERARDCNVMGQQGKLPISPERKRYRMLCEAIKPHIRCDERTLVRQKMDQINRSYRCTLIERKAAELVKGSYQGRLWDMI